MFEKLIHLEGIDPLEFFGINNAKMNLIKSFFPKLIIVYRGNDVILKGDDAEILRFENKFHLVLNHYNQFNVLPDEIINQIFLDEEGTIETIDEEKDVLLFGINGKAIKARTPNQKVFVDVCKTSDLIFAIGPAGTGKTYTAIALAVRALKNREIKRGIIAADSLNSSHIKSTFYNNMGNCYMYSNRPDSAFYYFNKCLLLDSANNNLNFMVDNYLTLGGLALQQKLLSQAKDFFHRTIILSDSIHENQAKYQAWQQLAIIYRQENNLINAITAKDSATAVKDRIINENSENKIAELQELYETEKKEQTIALQQSKLSTQQILLAGSAVSLALILFSGWLMYRRYTLKKEKEMQESLLQQREKATLDILQAEEKERRRIAAELHDGVGQVMVAAWMNLQVLESQMSAFDLPQQQLLAKATSMVGEGCKEVREVSHSMMPNALLSKGLISAIRNFTQQIDIKVIDINLHTEGLDEPIDEVVESILYRVIQESVNNTIRHANANQLDISLHKTPEGISLLIEDNGKGFDTSFLMDTNRKFGGLGLQNIKSRIAFLKGSVHWDSSPGNGTVVSIYIPVKK